MSKEINIVRANGSTRVELWDGRKAGPGEPQAVTISEAADLLGRDPDDWKVPAADEAGLVKTELKRRADESKKAADAEAKAAAGSGGGA